jgi:hypothetical protein
MIESTPFQNPQTFLPVLSQNLLGLGKILFFMEPVMYLQKRFLMINSAIWSTVNSLVSMASFMDEKYCSEARLISSH